MNDELQLLQTLKSLYNDGLYDKALETLIVNERLIEKKYYDIIKIKILCLIKLNKLIEASVIIKEELSVAYIPKDFEKFLFEVKQEINFLLRDNNRKTITFEDLEDIDKLDNDSLISILPKLKEFNLSLLTNKFQNIFNNPNISNLNKSLLIACLSDYKLNHKFSVVKENNLIKFNTIDVFDIRSGDNYAYINDKLKSFKNIEINYFDLIKRLIMSYLLDIYPLVICEKSCDELIAASIILLNQMMNSDIDYKTFIENNGLNQENIKKYCQKINILLETI